MARLELCHCWNAWNGLTQCLQAFAAPKGTADSVGNDNQERQAHLQGTFASLRMTAVELARWKASVCEVVRPEGVEPPTYWFVASCSIQLSYGRTLRGGLATALGYATLEARATVRWGEVGVRLTQRTFSRGGYDALRLVAVLRGHRLVSGQHLGGSKRLLPVAGGVRCNLRGFRSLKSRPLHLLPDLLGTRAGRIEVRLRIALNFRCATLPRLDLVAQLPEL